MSNPYGAPPDNPDQPGQVRGWAVAIGIVLGLVATFVWMTVVFVVAYSLSVDQYREGAGTVPDWLVGLFFVAPFPLAVVLLCFRRTRQAAAGFVMGMAIGTLVIAGICGSFFVPGLVA